MYCGKRIVIHTHSEVIPRHVPPKLSQWDWPKRGNSQQFVQPNPTQPLQYTTFLQMAAQRIPALWPTIWRSTETYNFAARSARAAAFRAYHPSRRRNQQQEQHLPHQRYGTANEPPPHLTGQEKLGPPSPKKDGQVRASQPKVEAQPEAKEVKTEQSGKQEPEAEKREPATVEGRVATQQPGPEFHSGGDEAPEEPGHYGHDESSSDGEKSAEPSLLYTTQPAHSRRADESRVEEHDDHAVDAVPTKAPHIERPRYIHHFDTYSLVNRLVEGGWDEKRAITTMKAVRLMLADNINLARDALVSKSFLENEAYLFKAASAELKTEVTSRRKGEQDKMRTERTQLQHEVDILSQRLSQESAHLKDDLKGMFDDRKMAVRNEQRDMESKIQQLNNKITVELQADAKSEVEGLRWLMTRRVIMTLAAVILMTVVGLKLVSDAYAAEAEEASKKLKVGGGKGGGGGGGGKGGNIQQAEHAAEEALRRVRHGDMAFKDGENPSFVSLG